MRDLSRATLLIFLLFSPIFFVRAVNLLDVVINEIAWMGTETSYNDEWIELHNNTDSPIDLEGWILKSADGTPKINLTGEIFAKSFYLLERTDDNTVPDIPADQIYTEALGNTGERLELYDGSGNLIDLVDCSSGWFAGDNKTKQTMERKNPQLDGSNPENWQTSQNPSGTSKAKNSIFTETEIVDVKPQRPKAEPEPKEEEPKLIIYPSGIIINEILPSPEGPDEEEEWIEIFNQNNFEVDLSNWQIVDTEGKTTAFTFPSGTKIAPNGFLVLSRLTTKITLNNDGDGLNLIQPNGNIIDSVTYGKAPRAQSYNQIDSDWAWSNALTPGSANIIPKSVVETKETVTLEKEIKETAPKEERKEGIKSEQELAAIGKQIPEEKSNFFSILSTALALAIFSGIIILTIKRKLKTSYNKNV